MDKYKKIDIDNTIKKCAMAFIMTCLAICFSLLGGKVTAFAEFYDGNFCYTVLSEDESGNKRVEVSKGKNISGNVIIPKTVTYDGVTYAVMRIAEEGFYHCTEITSVQIPDSVTGIGRYAFNGCSGLTEITIPDSVTSIESDAFYGCGEIIINIKAEHIEKNGSGQKYWGGISSKIKKVNIVGEFTTIRSEAFYNCSGLTEFTIPNGVTSIGNSAFYGCSGLTEITIPDSVTSIGNSAFYGCTGLTEITIPDSVTTIGSYAFENCGKVISLNIKAEYIEQDYGDHSNINYWRDISYYIKKVYVVGEYTKIGDYAFCDCSGLTEFTIPNSVTSIGDSAFYHCSSLTTITIPDSVTSIGESAFYNCGDIIINIKAEYIEQDYDKYSNKSYWRNISYYIKKVNIVGEYTKIGSCALYECKNLSEFTIPNSVTSIGDSVFAECSSLTTIAIPDSVTSVGYSVFYHCSSLTTITIPDSVTSIGDLAFYHCSSLTTITIPDSVTRIGGSVFAECSSLTTIAIPDSVTGIGSSAFSGCSKLKEITIPNGVTNISYNMFYNCTRLEKIEIKGNVIRVESNAFSGCSSLTEIVLPDSVTRIGSKAFYNCTKLKKITLPQSSKEFTIDENAFEGCESLESIVLPNGLIGIGTYAFKNCTALKTATIGNGLKEIKEGVFVSCSNLETVTIPDSVTDVAITAFRYCSKLGQVNFLGTEEEWNAVTIGNYNDPLKNAKKTFHVHTIVTDPAVQATCLATGLTSGKHCSGCGKTIEAQKQVSKSSHRYTKLQSNTYYHWYVCATEGCTSEENLMYEHEFGRNNPACSVCGAANPNYNASAPTEQPAGKPTDDPAPTTSPVPTTSPAPTTSTGATNTPAPTNKPSTGQTGTPGSQESAPKPGMRITDAGNRVEYVVLQTSAGTEPEVSYAKDNTNATSITIPATVTLGGITYKITAISDGAFKNNKKLKKVTIGANVTTIGKKAFNKCTSLKTVNIKSKKLKKVGGSAFKGINKKATIKVPKASKKAYQKLLKKKVDKTTKIK